MITGGYNALYNASVLRSVEVFIPGTGTSHCSLPSLPQGTKSHSQTGLTQCGGGGGSLQSCHQFINGQWTKSHSLSEKREDHSSWQTEEGSILLLGGLYSGTTTEVLTDSGEVSPGFPLKYKTE